MILSIPASPLPPRAVMRACSSSLLSISWVRTAIVMQVGLKVWRVEIIKSFRFPALVFGSHVTFAQTLRLAVPSPVEVRALPRPRGAGRGVAGGWGGAVLEAPAPALTKRSRGAPRAAPGGAGLVPSQPQDGAVRCLGTRGHRVALPGHRVPGLLRGRGGPDASRCEERAHTAA